MTATILGILTPVVVSASVTTGVTAAAAALAAVMYVGYQLSTGPSRDGEAKAKRAIVALAKSLDLLAATPPGSRRRAPPPTGPMSPRSASGRSRKSARMPSQAHRHAR